MEKWIKRLKETGIYNYVDIYLDLANPEISFSICSGSKRPSVNRTEYFGLVTLRCAVEDGNVQLAQAVAQKVEAAWPSYKAAFRLALEYNRQMPGKLKPVKISRRSKKTFYGEHLNREKWERFSHSEREEVIMKSLETTLGIETKGDTFGDFNFPIPGATAISYTASPKEKHEMLSKAMLHEDRLVRHWKTRVMKHPLNR